jgi:hypothetical protein
MSGHSCGLYAAANTSIFNHTESFLQSRARSGFFIGKGALGVMVKKSDKDGFDVFIPWLIGVGAVLATGIVLAAVVCHFLVGLDIPFVSIYNYQTAQYWGQLGDFIGGILNPLLSFVALMAVLYSVRMQRKELGLARADARENYRIQIQQRQNFERQNFESVFFRLLDIHTRLTNELKIFSHEFELDPEGRSYHGRDAFNHIYSEGFNKGVTGNREWHDTIEKAVKDFERKYARYLAHYFRNFYQILKHVDSFGIDPLRMNRRFSFLFIRQLVVQYKNQRVYANMLRAQLDDAELGVLFLNCLTAKGSGLKYYIERYSMLKHFEIENFQKESNVGLLFFDALAFADGEDVTPAILRTHYQSAHKEK